MNVNAILSQPLTHEESLTEYPQPASDELLEVVQSEIIQKKLIASRLLFIFLKGAAVKLVRCIKAKGLGSPFNNSIITFFNTEFYNFSN